MTKMLRLLLIWLAAWFAATVHASPADDARRAEAQAWFTDLPVVTQRGETLRFYSDVLQDRVVVINFIFTHCSAACPLMTQTLVQVRRALGPRFGEEIFFVSISIDPERDTPAALAKFAADQHAEDPGWYFLTGDKRAIDRIVQQFGQYSENIEAHSTLILAGNDRTRHWAKIRPGTSAAGMALQLEALAAEL